jgi:hypothetical protein
MQVFPCTFDAVQTIVLGHADDDQVAQALVKYHQCKLISGVPSCRLRRAF